MSVNNFSLKMWARLLWCHLLYSDYNFSCILDASSVKVFRFSSKVFKRQSCFSSFNFPTWCWWCVNRVTTPSQHRLNVSTRFCKSASLYATKYRKVMGSAFWLITCFGCNSKRCEKILDNTLCFYITNWFSDIKCCEKALLSDIVKRFTMYYLSLE